MGSCLRTRTPFWFVSGWAETVLSLCSRAVGKAFGDAGLLWFKLRRLRRLMSSCLRTRVPFWFASGWAEAVLSPCSRAAGNAFGDAGLLWFKLRRLQPHDL